jgi:hypothetical protein
MLCTLGGRPLRDRVDKLRAGGGRGGGESFFSACGSGDRVAAEVVAVGMESFSAAVSDISGCSGLGTATESSWLLLAVLLLLDALSLFAGTDGLDIDEGRFGVEEVSDGEIKGCEILRP